MFETDFSLKRHKWPRKKFFEHYQSQEKCKWKHYFPSCGNLGIPHRILTGYRNYIRKFTGLKTNDIRRLRASGWGGLKNRNWVETFSNTWIKGDKLKTRTAGGSNVYMIRVKTRHAQEERKRSEMMLSLYCSICSFFFKLINLIFLKNVSFLI